jgi:hypothetical protein
MKFIDLTAGTQRIEHKQQTEPVACDLPPDNILKEVLFWLSHIIKSTVPDYGVFHSFYIW